MRPSEFYRRCVQFNWAWRDRSEWGDNPNEEHQLRRIAEERP